MKKKYTTKKTYTKEKIDIILTFAIIDLQLSYLLAFLGREQIAETLSITIAAEIIGVMLGYFMKSFFETREEKRMRLEEYKCQMSETDQDDISVG